MAVVLRRYGSRNIKVSTQWLAVLRAADHNEIQFIVNSGARNEVEQKRLIALKGCWSRTNTDGAACPWYRSRHVVSWRTGPAHALDVDDWRDGENRLQRWINSHRFVTVKSGKAINPVPGEAWHLEIGRLSLWRLYRKYRRFV